MIDRRDVLWSEDRERTLLSEVAFFRRLSVRDLDNLRHSIARFVQEKEIIGHGIEVDDRVRLLVAAPACRLALNLPGETYTRLRGVHLFPTTFEDTSGAPILGTATVYNVALALDALEAGLACESGDNVGYHEFAHVLDASDGISDGVPPLLVDPSLHRVWTRTMGAALARLQAAVEASEPTTFLDARASKNEAELFAYATEAFFGVPAWLLGAHPDLYDLLMRYYRQNPLNDEGR